MESVFGIGGNLGTQHKGFVKLNNYGNRKFNFEDDDEEIENYEVPTFKSKTASQRTTLGDSQQLSDEIGRFIGNSSDSD